MESRREGIGLAHDKMAGWCFLFLLKLKKRGQFFCLGQFLGVLKFVIKYVFMYIPIPFGYSVAITGRVARLANVHAIFPFDINMAVILGRALPVGFYTAILHADRHPIKQHRGTGIKKPDRLYIRFLIICLHNGLRFVKQEPSLRPRKCHTADDPKL